jgi:alkylation response protein AidB-like acyl-CoA dehydrogenase
MNCNGVAAVPLPAVSAAALHRETPPSSVLMGKIGDMIMPNKLTDLKDQRFILYEQLKIENLCESQRFEDHSKETFSMIFDAAEKLALNDFAPVNSEGDEIGCRFRDGEVKTPEPFKEPFKKYCAGGWIAMSEDYEVGGQLAPVSVGFACNEMFFAANHSLTGYMGLTHSAAKVIEVHGTEEQKNKYMLPLYEGRFAGSMQLTEAQAGSDVGALRTKASKNADGSYSITGSKIFITGGEQDLTENIIHIVLARVEGAPEGTRGLSCFVVPKILVNEDGSLGERNDVICGGIEHKMGMKGSATCVLNYGENGTCKGELLGPEGQGIVVMFHMMNEQRALVGLQGLAQGSTAYLHALDFAMERLQGPQFGTKDAKQVPIIRHPDVKRHLMWMKAHTEGMRALTLYLVYCMDAMSVEESDDQRAKWQDLIEILTPICKSYCTDKGFEVCAKSIQVHGGYGYCREYMVEQFTRDCKVMSIYEGTNGIQALDLFGRKIRMRNGATLNTVLEEMNKTVQDVLKVDGMAPYAEEVKQAVSVLQKTTDYLLEQSKSEDAYLSYSWASSYLKIFGDTVLGWLFLWQAAIAQKRLAQSPTDASFYKSKVNTARFFIGSVLPTIHGKSRAIMQNEKALLSVDETSFTYEVS